MDNKQLTKLIAAMVLGDGFLGWRDAKKKSPRLAERPQYDKPINSWYGSAHIAKNRDYVEWQCEVLENVTSVSVREYEARQSTNGYIDAAKITYETKRHPFFTPMRHRTYVNGIKTISPHDIKLFDAESLAILYMDNGWNEEQGRIGIATHAYSWADNKFLRDCIAEQCGVHLNVRTHKQKNGSIKYYLRSNNEQGKVLKDIVYRTGLITPSFEYKLENSERVAPAFLQDDDIVSSLGKYNQEG